MLQLELVIMVTITRIINEKRNPSRATCQKIIDRFPQYSFDWLFSGIGNILNEGQIVSIKSGEERVETENNTNIPFISNANRLETTGFMNVPLVHIRAQCGYLNGYGDEGYLESLPSLPVIVDRTYHGKYMLFEAEGDSMDDGFQRFYLRWRYCIGKEKLTEIYGDTNFILEIGILLLYIARKE